MIDWITAYIPLEVFSADDIERLRLQGDRIVRYCPKTGDVRYETSAWDSIRSDSHQVVCRVGSALWVQGSPARVIGDGDTVFSSGASKAEDVGGCLERMLAFLYPKLGLVGRPALQSWTITRVDVTRHLFLASLAEVRQYLAILRNAEGGRLKVNNPDGDTVYWNKASRYKKSKAYAKGPQLRRQCKNPDYSGRRYSEEELELADRLVRLELTLFQREWKKNLGLDHWSQLTPEILDREWHKRFDQFVGQTIMNDEELKRRIESVEVKKNGELVRISKGQAKAAYTAWFLIKAMGYNMAQDSMSKSTWYRNLRILKLAGLKVTDLGNGKIIPFRVQKVVSGMQVESWAQLRKAA